MPEKSHDKKLPVGGDNGTKTKASELGFQRYQSKLQEHSVILIINRSFMEIYGNFGNLILE